MKVIIRLVGYSEIIDDEKYVYEYVCKVNTIFNFEILKMIFNKYEHIISTSELDNCTLTCNSKNLKKDCLVDSNTLLDNDVIHRVFIFTGITSIKNKLINIFKLDGYKISINNILANTKKDDSDNESVNSLKVQTKEELNNSNKDSFESDEETNEKLQEVLEKLDSEESDNEFQIEDTDPSEIKQYLDLFKDNDFITLIRIYKNRGELFNDFYKYINSSQIINFKKLENETDLTNNINFIKELNLNFEEEHIIEALKKTGNHLNLAIRYLLQNI